jgi:hypothetical protein
MDFKKWLTNELFNSPSQIQWKNGKYGNKIGKFIINDKKYQMIIASPMMQGGPSEISFQLILPNGEKSEEITGTGDEFSVFATVLDGIQHWIKSYNPKSFIMSAKEPNRKSLYRRMLSLFNKGEWITEEISDGTFLVYNKKSKKPTEYSDDEFEPYFSDDY